MKRSRERVLTDGLIAGTLGYLVLAVFFAVANALAGRSPFYTAALLGDAFFFGLRDAAAVQVGPAPVIAYNGVHLVVFLAIGFLIAWGANQLERHPDLSYFSFVLAFAAFLSSYVLVLILGGAVAQALPWPLVAGGNAAAGAAMGAYLWWSHPGLRAGLGSEGEARAGGHNASVREQEPDRRAQRPMQAGPPRSL
jgi:hypothetical protein